MIFFKLLLSAFSKARENNIKKYENNSIKEKYKPFLLFKIFYSL